MDNMNKLSVYERPLHCTDVKRETLYIKDENEWCKDNNNNVLDFTKDKENIDEFLNFIIEKFNDESFINAFLKVGKVGVFYAISFSICNITFIISIQNTNVANTLIMIALAPMLSAILGAIFLKEMPSKGTWIAIFITFLAALFIFYDSLQVGNLFGNIMGFVTAAGLAVNAVLIRYAKDRDLLPSAVMGKLGVAVFAFFFVENFNLIGSDQIYIPLMCVVCVALPFVLVTIAPRYIPAEEVNLFFLLETIIGPIWVWLVIKEQPSFETIIGGAVIIITLGVHSFIKLREPQKIIN